MSPDVVTWSPLRMPVFVRPAERDYLSRIAADVILRLGGANVAVSVLLLT